MSKKCDHDFQQHVHNVTKNIMEFMCLKCGHSLSDEWFKGCITHDKGGIKS